MMSIECARQILEVLDEGMLDASLPLISNLFEAASLLAQAGDLAAKGRIYEAIFARPDATRGDKLRVEIYRLDLVRRKGESAAALQGLKELESRLAGGDVWLYYDYFRARAECHVRLEQAAEAVECYRSGVWLAGNVLPVDKLIDLIEGLVHCKLKAGQVDQEADKHLEEWRRLLETSPSLQGVAKSRATGHYYLYKGGLCSVRQEWVDACGNFGQAFQFCPSDREKVVCAMEYLHAAWRQDPRIADEAAAQMIGFFREHSKELSPGDVQVWRESYDFVMERLTATP